VCKTCTSEDKKREYSKNRENHKKRMRNANLKRKYGIGQEDYEKKLHEQNECCEICKRHISELKQKKLCVDHNHKTGIVRGLLCPSCNRLIGVSIEKTEILKSAIKYLDKYECKENAFCG
jgi:hypothetical protein